MADPFYGEIRLMAFDFAPYGWARCDGQLLPINQNQALFALLGTTFGGNGVYTFGLPDLRGRIPIHVGGGRELGDSGGEQGHTLSSAELPPHKHALNASSTNAGSSDPTNRVLAQSNNIYHSATSLTALSPASVSSSTGGNQAHPNMQPFLVISFCIALRGVFPTRF